MNHGVKKNSLHIDSSPLIAFGINYFLIPHHLINGGMIDVGLIANYAFEIIYSLMMNVI